MRVVLQRVSRAVVRVDDRVVGSIGRGFLALVGFTAGDSRSELAWMAEKIVGLRVFPDAAGRMNCDIKEIGGAILVVSQFTLSLTGKTREVTYAKLGRTIFRVQIQSSRPMTSRV